MLPNVAEITGVDETGRNRRSDLIQPHGAAVNKKKLTKLFFGPFCALCRFAVINVALSWRELASIDQFISPAAKRADGVLVIVDS